ncbi:hypothetical protein D3C76_1070010 [compost metagenome]
MPGFPRLLGRTAGHGQHGLQRVLAGTQVTAVTLTDFHQAAECQHAHGFAHGIAADAHFNRQHRLGRQSLAYLPVTLKDAFAHAFDGQFDQGTPGQFAAHDTQPIIR